MSALTDTEGLKDMSSGPKKICHREGGFVSSAIFLIKYASGLALPDGIASQRAI